MIKVKRKGIWLWKNKWRYVVQHYRPVLGWTDWIWEDKKEKAREELDNCRRHRKRKRISF